MARRAVPYRTASKENYQAFCKDYPGVNLSYLEWSSIIYTGNMAFRDYLLETGERAKLPWGFGEYMVAKKKKKKTKTLPDGTEKMNLSINWKATKELGKKIYHLNHHTEGFNFYWKWDLRTARFYQATAWRFKAARVTSRLINHYVHLPGYQHLYKEWDSL
jgi:hypothetical protein